MLDFTQLEAITALHSRTLDFPSWVDVTHLIYTLIHPQSQPRHPYQYQHPTLSINPAYVLPAHFYSSHLTQHQPTSQSQGTLSPHVLHSPTSTMIGQLSSFYAQSPSTPSTSTATTATSTAAAPVQPPTINIQARKDSFITDVRPLLQPSAFGGARAINNLVNLIDDFGSEEVEPALRMEILTKICDNAANHYFRAWSRLQFASILYKDH